MLSAIRELLLHPDTFFERISQEKVNLIPPVAIVAAGLIVPFLPYAIAGLYFSFTAGNASHYVGWMGLIQVYFLTVVVMPLIAWGVMSFGSYGISSGLGGKGSLVETLQNTGYGMLPWALATILSTVMYGILFFAGHILSPVSTVEDYAHSVYELYPYLDLIALCWGGYLWIFATRYTQRFTLRKAAAVTIVPVILVIWLTIPVQAWIDAIRTIGSGI